MSNLFEERRRAEAAHGYINDLREFASDMRELVVLLKEYGDERFGGEWNPEHAESVMDDSKAARLRSLLVRLS